MSTSQSSARLPRASILALVFAAGCPDDASEATPSTNTLSDTTDDDGGAQTVTATVDPDSTDGSTDAGETEGTTGTTATTDDTTSGDTTTGDATSGAECGNGVIQATEQCDAPDLGGQDCESQGFTGGALGCNADCTFDTTACIGGVCGNGVVERTEVCDGANLGGGTCIGLGFTGGGVLACAGDCSTFDTAGCIPGRDGDCCAVQPTPGCIDPACEAAICGADAYCCDTEWDGACVDAANIEPECAGIGGSCPEADVCGNGVVEPPEVCDAGNFDGETCQSQGFPGGGDLSCADDCTGIDTSNCFLEGGGDCCAAHGSVGCDDPGCEAAICGADAYCCDVEWDGICANDALVAAACVGVGGSCPDGGVSDCCVANGTPGCDDATCEDQICAVDPYCCDTEWDDACVAAGLTACTVCGGDPECAHDICIVGDPLFAGCDPCVQQICAVDEFCCEENWDNQCVDQVDSVCGQFCL